MVGQRHTIGPVSVFLGAGSDVIVTKYGAVDLRGRTLTDHACALVAIAHPEHRGRCAEPVPDSAGLI